MIYLGKHRNNFILVRKTKKKHKRFHHCICPQVDKNVKKIDSILYYIHNNPEKDLSLAFLSEKIRYSPEYTSRIFKRQLGINLQTYIRKYRLYNARNTLAKTDWSITQIAE
ncbi:MAG: AraC family transcriptional regulator, partial [Streptococcaceae bacterium]|nr:AraC family transcriptional regulator [Streptococcaceae bacterium]